MDNIFEHSQDSEELHLLFHKHVHLPSVPLPWGGELQITKFMLMEVIAAVVLVAIFVPLARRATGQTVPKGRVWNFFEAILLFLRDEVARPAIGKHDADRYLPFLWTVFMFILVCNLLGMVPFGGSATGSVSVTGPLALCTLVTVLVSGMQKLGVAGFWQAQVPHMDLPGPLGFVLKPMIFVLEVLGMAIRHAVLAVRLFANIFGGHTVLAVILGFIVTMANLASGLIFIVAPASVLGTVALSLLELFVAFLQAYIFTFLSALFIGAALHPH